MKNEILKTLEEYLAIIEGEIDREEEIQNLKNQIFYIRNSIYVSRLKAFREHMSECFDVMMGDNCTNESVDRFYRSEFKIAWRGKTITLCNGAAVFQAIEELIETEIDDNEEDF